MSMTNCVLSVEYTEMSPPVPAGTTAAFATIVPVGSFRVETTGWDWPVGHTDREPTEAPGTTVKLNEYAAALTPEGMQVLFSTGKSRGVRENSCGGPRPVGLVESRVSATRQGGSG